MAEERVSFLKRLGNDDNFSDSVIGLAIFLMAPEILWSVRGHCVCVYIHT